MHERMMAPLNISNLVVRASMIEILTFIYFVEFDTVARYVVQISSHNIKLKEKHFHIEVKKGMEFQMDIVTGNSILRVICIELMIETDERI